MKSADFVNIKPNAVRLVLDWLENHYPCLEKWIF